MHWVLHNPALAECLNHECKQAGGMASVSVEHLVLSHAIFLGSAVSSTVGNRGFLFYSVKHGRQ